MPFYERENVRIHYQESGAGFPLLIIQSGGLDSNIAPGGAPFDAVSTFEDEYRCITMDLRTSSLGRSRGPLDADRPWDMHTDDQLGVLDHLGVDRFLVLGFCIGNPLTWNLLQRAPRRVVAAVCAQPSAVDPENPDFFYNRSLSSWAPALMARRPQISQAQIERFARAAYRDRDFVITATRDFVRACPTPLLVLPDDIEPHPYGMAMEMVRL